MFIKNYMAANPITIDEDASVVRAAEIMKETGVHRFPVVDNNELVGMVTDRDLRSAAPSQVVSFDEQERKLFPELYDLLKKIKVGEIMKTDVISITSDRSVVKAADIMLKNHISGLPVVDSQKKLIGIITQSDIFKVLVDLSGIKTGKITLGFRLEDSPGSIKKVVDIIRQNDGRVAGIFTTYPPEEPGYRDVYIRIRDVASEKLEQIKNVVEEKANLLCVIDDS
ncbi:MAG: CBS domain-containing protein [Deltaproteobacteria bacterium]|nr:CBS domain-containing protein [Deltaproteobacteria bacterium]